MNGGGATSPEFPGTATAAAATTHIRRRHATGVTQLAGGTGVTLAACASTARAGGAIPRLTRASAAA